MYISTTYPAYAILEAKDNESHMWCQSIYLSQNAYSSDFLNNWNGKYYLDAENDMLMSAMLGAGKKDNENKFSGILIGNIKSDNTEKLGLFGYHKGL